MNDQNEFQDDANCVRDLDAKELRDGDQIVFGLVCLALALAFASGFVFGVSTAVLIK